MNTPLKTIIIGNTIKALTFSTFVPFLLLTSCKKSSNSSVAPNNSVAANPASRMTGVWAMRGTHEYLAHGITDIINTTVTLWLADDTTIVAFSNGTIYPGYSVYKFNLGSDSIYVFGDYACNVKKDSLQYHIFYPSSGNYQIVSLQSISHTPFANSTISASTAKMVGRKQWHGTYRTNYVHPWYTGLPDVDTTY